MPSDQQKAAYLSVQSFISLLWSNGLIDGWDFALWQLRGALESDVEHEEERQLQVAAAGLWILHAGPRVWQLVVDTPAYAGAEVRSMRAGDKFDGPGGYSFQRWEYWQQSFEGRVDSQGVDGSIAKRAVSVMKGLSGDV